MQVCRQWAGGAADGLRGHRCGAGAGAGLLLAGGAGGRGDLLRWWCAGVVIVRAARSSGRAGLLIRQAGQAAGLEDGQKKKARAAARGALLLWPSVCAGGAICCAGCVPVHIVGGGGLFPCSGAGPLLALALIRAQRFQLATFQRGTGCAGGAPSGPFLPFAGGVRFST